jgi:hypothetical protein
MRTCYTEYKNFRGCAKVSQWHARRLILLEYKEGIE